MKCDKCGMDIDLDYGYRRLNGGTYHNGVCPTSLPTLSAVGDCNSNIFVGMDLSRGCDYVAIPSTEYKKLKDTIEAQQQEIERLKSQVSGCDRCYFFLDAGRCNDVMIEQRREIERLKTSETANIGIIEALTLDSKQMEADAAKIPDICGYNCDTHQRLGGCPTICPRYGKE